MTDELIEAVARIIKDQIIMDMASAREAATAAIPVVEAHVAFTVRSEIEIAHLNELKKYEARIAELENHLARVLHRYSGAWHPDSIFQQEYGHEIEAARNALRPTQGEVK